MNEIISPANMNDRVKVSHSFIVVGNPYPPLQLPLFFPIKNKNKNKKYKNYIKLY